MAIIWQSSKFVFAKDKFVSGDVPTRFSAVAEAISIQLSISSNRRNCPNPCWLESQKLQSLDLIKTIWKNCSHEFNYCNLFSFPIFPLSKTTISIYFNYFPYKNLKPAVVWSWSKLPVLRWPGPLRRHGPDVRGDARTGTAVQAHGDGHGLEHGGWVKTSQNPWKNLVIFTL